MDREDMFCPIRHGQTGGKCTESCLFYNEVESQDPCLIKQGLVALVALELEVRPQ